ncbi:MAG: 50S ribosomal protein L32 [Planctomycetaceae bacterium]
MAVPKHKTSKMRKRHRRSANLKKTAPQCQTPVPTHVVCPNCGFYQGRTLVEIED